jgi:hypothetical protein
MKHLNHLEAYVHRVDKNNIIVAVSDNWKSFAQDNLGARTLFPENIIGSSLWDHIRDLETRYLYEMILQKVREHNRPVAFSFRCDAPDKRRFLKLSVIPMKDGTVEFISQIIKTESRKPVELLRSDLERSDEKIRICSMCKKIAISETEWKEIESAIQELKLFEKDMLPQFTHGVCKSCFEAAMIELDRLS